MKRTTGFSNEEKSKFMRGSSHKARKRHGRYNNSEATIFKRVIRDGYGGQEFIVYGDASTTFGEACKKQWQFESVKRNSKWFIKDEKGNDVSDRTLETVDGIFYLVPEYGSGMQKEETDEEEKYSSIHDSVTYYD